MLLFRDKNDWLEWQKNHVYDGDEVGKPVEFPCFMYTSVLDWNNRAERANYLHRGNLKKMLAELSGGIDNEVFLDWVNEHEDNFMKFIKLTREYPTVPVLRLLAEVFEPVPELSPLAGRKTQ